MDPENCNSSLSSLLIKPKTPLQKSRETVIKSEPNVKRLALSDKTNISNGKSSSSLATKVISADSAEFEDALFFDGHRNESDKSKSEPVKQHSQKARNRVLTLPLEPAKKKEFAVNARFLSRLLKHDTMIEEELGAECDDQLKLFEFLQREGKLSHKVLAIFSKCKGIRSVSMTPSYGSVVDDLGLCTPPQFPVEKCTRSFYSGFKDLQILDFTNVPLHDDELRFLIKLDKLQALGLSGTKITCKSIKYLTQYASFKSTLKCLKLCFADGLDDAIFSLLPMFTCIQEVDLRGCSALTLPGALNMFSQGKLSPSFLRTLALPEQISIKLTEKQDFYRDLKRAKPELISDPNDISIPLLAEDNLKRQLKWHKQVYPDIYLNMNLESLRNKLMAILRLRRQEQTLHSLAGNKQM